MNPVRLAVFSQALADPESEQVQRLVEELAALDPRLTAESKLRARQGEGGGARRSRAPRPSPILGADKDYGIRFYGLPSGYEFGTLVDAILDVSQRGERPRRRDPGRRSAALERPVHLQVFSTPT